MAAEEEKKKKKGKRKGLGGLSPEKKKKLKVYTLTISEYCSRERSGSVVECLTRDREATGSSLTDVTAMWSFRKTHLSELNTGSTKEDPSLFN